MKTFIEFTEQKTNPYSKLNASQADLHKLAAEFKEGYGEHMRDTYVNIREQIMFMAGNLKSNTYWGSDWKSSIKTNEDMESWIIQYVVPILKKHNWPKKDSKQMSDALHELKLQIMKSDPSAKP